jgi:hypothetical protein
MATDKANKPHDMTNIAKVMATGRMAAELARQAEERRAYMRELMRKKRAR